MWQLQVAKNKLSEVVDLAVRAGPQIITRRGREVAVVLGLDDYRRLSLREENLADFLLASPLRGSRLDTRRSRDAGRDVKL